MPEIGVVSIPLTYGALCVDCLVLFDSRRGACPNCATLVGWLMVQRVPIPPEDETSQNEKTPAATGA